MNSGNVYEEVYEVLGLMAPQTVMKIPLHILEKIKEIRNPNYKTKIDSNDIFNENNISKEAVDILCWLNYSFIIDEKRKASIDRIVEEKTRTRYNPETIFRKREEITPSNVENAAIDIVPDKESIIKKIINKIKSIFNKKDG